ncbi:MAG: pyrimidine/purine nucleoside phosphorylase [Syntrophotaleaceae bacterium]
MPVGEFNNVSVIKKANVYFDGMVTSRTVRFEDGTEKTLGMMLPGEYRFNADAQETMEILSGELEVQVAGDSEWKTIKGARLLWCWPGPFFVAKVKAVSTDYCCSYMR